MTLYFGLDTNVALMLLVINRNSYTSLLQMFMRDLLVISVTCSRQPRATVLEVTLRSVFLQSVIENSQFPVSQLPKLKVRGLKCVLSDHTKGLR